MSFIWLLFSSLSCLILLYCALNYSLNWYWPCSVCPCETVRQCHLKDGDPGVADVVEGDGVVEWIGVSDTARRVVTIPVDARLISGRRRWRRPWAVVGQRRVTVCPVQLERQQVVAFGHPVGVWHATDEVEAALTVERRQRHAST